MKLFSGITINESGPNMSIRGMRSGMKLYDIITSNITGFNMPGYQKKVAVKTSFAEYIGSHAVEGITDTSPGRMLSTGNPLDMIIEESGYFQIQGKDTVNLTRDGRFEIDKDGYLVSLAQEKVLGADGEPIHFKEIPGEYKDIKVDDDGTINIYNKTFNKQFIIGKLGIASEDGTPARDAKVKQGIVEASNVNLADEFFSMLPIRRNFEANKQAFVLQNENINKLIQMLGRGQ